MSFGIEVKRTATDSLLSLTTLGGRVFLGTYSSPATVTTVYDFPDVPTGADLTRYILQGGGHNPTTSTVTSGSTTYARLSLTRTYTTISQFRRNPSSLVAVFGNNTVEPDYGISLTNTSGERTASTKYPVPTFIQKVTFSINSRTQGGLFYEGGWVHTEAASGVGRQRLVFYTLPTNSDAVYYAGNSFLSATDYVVSLVVMPPTTTTPYLLPEAYVFSLEPVPSSETYGIRVFNSSGNVTFDSGLQHLDVVGLGDISYGSADAAVTGTINTNNAILLPEYQRDTSVPVSSMDLSDITYRLGMVRRTSATGAVSRQVIIAENREDVAMSYDQSIGSVFNTLMIIDATKYASQASTPLAVEILTQATSTPTCTYNTWEGATSCSTSESFLASVFGGNGSSISYSWSLNTTAINNGYSISYGNGTVSVGIANNSGAGTKTGTLSVTITQGSTQVTASYTLGHVHVAAVSNLSGSISNTSGSTACSYNTGSASSCTTTAGYTVTTSGGSGNSLSYAWSLTNNTGSLSISGGTTGTSVTVTKTGAAGTYTATLNCVVTQSGAPNSPFTISQAISFSHIAQTGNAVQPIPGVTVGGQNVTPVDFGSNDDRTTPTASAYSRIWVESNGQVYIATNESPFKTAAYSSWWWSASSFDPVNPAGNWATGVPGIGDNYMVRFTRTSYTGQIAASTDTTGWLSLSTSRFVQTSAEVTTTSGTRNNSATYKIEISSNINNPDAGIVSTTNGPTLSAYARVGTAQ